MSDGILDTSVVVRYLAGSPRDQAVRARTLIDSDQPLTLTSTALLETYHVLATLYAVPRDGIVDALTRLLQRQNIRTADAEKVHVIRGLALCRGSGRVSCGDAMLWAAARSRSPAAGPATRIYSFDRRFPADEIEVVSP